ncbi:MAG: hypothetical protein KJ063_23335 [Anaerolineae bacterium]|nr:hypothetical protein [Anaerolineae bacterium]
MYNYPLTFNFAFMTASPKITVTDANGRTLMTANKALLSTKDEIKVANGRPLFQVISQESRVTDIPSNWDVLTSEGDKIGMVDDDFLSLDAGAFIGNGAAATGVNVLKNQFLNEQALKMYWLKNPSGQKVGWIAPDTRSLSLQQLPLADFTRKIPFFFRFICPSYVIRLGERTVMLMQKQRTWMIDSYKLEAKTQLTPDEENFLIPAVLLTLFYERVQLKHLFGE